MFLFRSKVIPLNTVIDKEDSVLMQLMKTAIAKKPVTKRMLKGMTKREISNLQYLFNHSHNLTFCRFEDLSKRLKLRLQISTDSKLGMTLEVI